MFKKSKKGYYFWEEFSRIKGLIHGFSTRRFGNMNIKNTRSSEHLKTFLGRLGINNKYIVKMNQVHGEDVAFVSSQDHGKIIDNTDGLVSQEKGVFLIGTFADCVPVLFLDKDKKIFGIVHAGWKGVYKEIVKCMVSKMIDNRSRSQNILVGIGPSIRVCCYNINEERERVFKDKFPKFKDITKRKRDKIFLDLAKIVRLQVIDCGILSQNILDCLLCTKDNISNFYSYRKEHGTNSFGLSSVIIGRV